VIELITRISRPVPAHYCLGGILGSEVVTTFSSFRSSELSSPSEVFSLLAPAKGAQLCLLKLSWTKLFNFVMSAHALKDWQNTIRPCRTSSSRSREMFAAPPRYWLWWLPQSCTASMGTTFQLSVAVFHYESQVRAPVFLPLQPVMDKPRPLTPCCPKVNSHFSSESVFCLQLEPTQFAQMFSCLRYGGKYVHK
jgi:hypothetical protein